MGTGTDVPIESAGITLVKGDLLGITKAIHISCATMRNIRQNLFFAFVYNALGVPLAAGALYPYFGILLSAMIAGAAMSVSSLSVILNALRLRKVSLGGKSVEDSSDRISPASEKSKAPLKQTKTETKMNSSKTGAIGPICGMTVDTTTALHAERDGETSYFCSEHFREKFLATTGDESLTRNPVAAVADNPDAPCLLTDSRLPPVRCSSRVFGRATTTQLPP